MARSISDYLQAQGHFMLVALPWLRTRVHVQRGSFGLLPVRTMKRLQRLRTEARSIIKSTAFPELFFQGIYYMPTSRCHEFQRRASSLYTRSCEFLCTVEHNWEELTAETRDLVADILSVRYTTNVQKTISHYEYTRDSLKGFDTYAKAGPMTKVFSFTYCKLQDLPVGSQPRTTDYLGVNARIWHWLVKSDASIAQRVEKSLTWLSERPKIYAAVTDAVYVTRDWKRDTTRVPLESYCTWLRLLGRNSACQLMELLKEQVHEFYTEYLGRNALNGCCTSRKAAIKVLSSVSDYIPKFREAMEAPLDVDAVVTEEKV